MLMSKHPSTIKTASPVDALRTFLGDDIAALNAEILARMESPVPLINQLAAYIIAAGGKRLRPLLTLAVARALGYEGTDHLKLAASVEFIHTATLLHDDVVDESDQRRGQPSANAMFGNQASVLVGDFLFSRAFQLMVETGSLEVLRILSTASAVIAEGEVMQLASTGNLALTRATYFDVIGAKTAALFAAASEVGAVIAKADPAIIAAVNAYGQSLGIAFQIADDVLDYQGSLETMGKNSGDDFREGKITLPVVMALENASSEERAFWERSLVELKQNDFDFSQALNILKKYNCLDASLEIAREHALAAQRALTVLPASAWRDTLKEIALFAVERST
ncbi:MAG: Farnesyltranstransferase [Alphaproteobacteria bacterium]|nr:Farnesyltranstransferase [Alphaproteobacteria bacterium]